MGDIDIATMLFLRYKSPVVALSTIIQDYLPHLNETTAKRYASKCELPFPAFRTDNSNRAVYLVNVADVAVWLENEREQARQDWQAMNA